MRNRYILGAVMFLVPAPFAAASFWLGLVALLGLMLLVHTAVTHGLTALINRKGAHRLDDSTPPAQPVPHTVPYPYDR